MGELRGYQAEALAWPAQTLAGSPGPGTSRVLRGLGVPAANIVASVRVQRAITALRNRLPKIGILSSALSCQRCSILAMQREIAYATTT